jgi:hypothetical protein
MEEHKVNKHPLLSTMIAALLVAATSTFTLPPAQGATTPMSASTNAVHACVGVERSMPENAQGVPACATALQKGLDSNSADLKALIMAAKTHDLASPKLLLMKYGLTKRQLNGAAIVIQNDTGANATRIKSITITCCPLTITIRF